MIYRCFLYYCTFLHILWFVICLLYLRMCAGEAVKQMIGWINIILLSNISYKRDGVDDFGRYNLVFYFSLQYGLYLHTT